MLGLRLLKSVPLCKSGSLLCISDVLLNGSSWAVKRRLHGKYQIRFCSHRSQYDDEHEMVGHYESSNFKEGGDIDRGYNKSFQAKGGGRKSEFDDNPIMNSQFDDDIMNDSGENFQDYRRGDERRGDPSKQDESFDQLLQTLSQPDWAKLDMQKLERTGIDDVLQKDKNKNDDNLDEIKSYHETHQIRVLMPKDGSCPHPYMDFESTPFPDYIKDYLRNRKKFTQPMPIQGVGWPVATSGLDLIGIGQTGSGKTLGYLLPALDKVAKQMKKLSETGSSNRNTKKNNRCPKVLVVAPTRELVNQIHSVTEEFVDLYNGHESLNMSTDVFYGGVKKSNTLYGIERNGVADIVICTPGRLLDLLTTMDYEGKAPFVNLNQVEYVVLDEADRMLDMGFKDQIEKILSQIRPDRQLLMWSATWPKEIQRLADTYFTADVPNSLVHFTIGTANLKANPNIKQIVEVCFETDKYERLLTVLKELKGSDIRDRTLIFAGKKKTVDFLVTKLSRFGYRAAGIHGDKSQSIRDNVISQFSAGRVPTLIATDVAARGLDIKDIKHVINYDFPNVIEDYVHRIGRTGRSDNTGISHTFFTDEDHKLAASLIEVLKETKQEVPSSLQELSICYNSVKGHRENTSRYGRFTHKQGSFRQPFTRTEGYSNQRYNSRQGRLSPSSEFGDDDEWQSRDNNRRSNSFSRSEYSSDDNNRRRRSPIMSRESDW